MTYYTHRFTTVTDYEVWEHFDNGYSRKVDPHNEVWWTALGNIPAKESGDRFISIVNGVPTLDPNKDAVLAAEANAIAAQQASDAAKAQAFIDNLPSWSQVNTAITNIANLADAKAFILKLTRVVYWLAKNSAT